MRSSLKIIVFLLYDMTQTESIPKRLEGKIAVITGGNSGIGLATAHRFVQEGAYVFIVGRRQSELDAAVKQIGKNIFGIQCDVSNLKDLDRLYDTVKSCVNTRIHLLVKYL
jgi:NAD(P)-dependent dehydrogenase (short-subunit alcohol dehydrogenase family)